MKKKSSGKSILEKKSSHSVNLRLLTKHFMIVNCKNPKIDRFYVSQKRRSSDLEAQILWNIPSEVLSNWSRLKIKLRDGTRNTKKYYILLATAIALLHFFNDVGFEVDLKKMLRYIAEGAWGVFNLQETVCSFKYVFCSFVSEHITNTNKFP